MGKQESKAGASEVDAIISKLEKAGKGFDEAKVFAAKEKSLVHKLLLISLSNAKNWIQTVVPNACTAFFSAMDIDH
jgi:hypothetical protein